MGPEAVVSETVRAKALAAGAAGWLDDLPEILASLALDWALTLGRVYDGATEAHVVEALVDGPGEPLPAVLKVMVPRSAADIRHETTVLRLAGGGRPLAQHPALGAPVAEGVHST